MLFRELIFPLLPLHSLSSSQGHRIRRVVRKSCQENAALRRCAIGEEQWKHELPLASSSEEPIQLGI
jgi:hypothetical protein